MKSRYTEKVVRVMPANTGPHRWYRMCDTRKSSSRVGATENTSCRSVNWSENRLVGYARKHKWCID